MFHLAAQALVRVSYAEPQLTFATNVLGSVNLMEAVRACDSVQALVYITSDKCYLNKEWAWGYRENDELGGRDPYSVSKACAELAFQAYNESYFLQRPQFGAATTRAGKSISSHTISRASLDRTAVSNTSSSPRAATVCSARSLAKKPGTSA